MKKFGATIGCNRLGHMTIYQIAQSSLFRIFSLLLLRQLLNTVNEKKPYYDKMGISTGQNRTENVNATDNRVSCHYDEENWNEDDWLDDEDWSEEDEWDEEDWEEDLDWIPDDWQEEDEDENDDDDWDEDMDIDDDDIWN